MVTLMDFFDESPFLCGVLSLIVCVFMIIVMWKIFTKAGLAGWIVLIPIYNLFMMITKLAKRPGWWILLLLVPFVNFVIMIFIIVDIAHNFGKGGGFAVGMILLGWIFYPILAFDQSKFKK